YKIYPYKKFLWISALFLSIISLILYIFFNREKLKEQIKLKTLIYSGNIILIVFLVFAILVALNYLTTKLHLRADLTEGKIHSLSEQTMKVLKNLKKEIEIRAFFRELNPRRGIMEEMLKRYSYYTTKMRYEIINPDKNPSLVRELNISEDGTTIFKCGEQETRITSTTEEDITNAIIKITRERKKIIYFTKGHGERSIENSSERGYSQVKTYLENLGYSVKEIVLAEESTFPTDCSLLIIAGAEKDFLKGELEGIERYLKEGGRLLLLIDPLSSHILVEFTKKYGIKIGDDFIVSIDPSARLMGGDPTWAVVSRYGYHKITEKFNYATFFPFARSVDRIEPVPKNISTEIIASTSPYSFATNQFNANEIRFDPQRDRRGPIPIVVSSKFKEEGKERESRIVVFGDSDFASNQFLELSGNSNLFFNTVNWLEEEEDLVSIAPKTTQPRTISLTISQGRMLFFITIIFLPGIFVLGGILVYLRRRSL
ncbi:MAG: GldG family protein, partial [Candidatus Aminicenantia bacterium]